LIVWRVNGSLVFLPHFFSLDISNILGSIISNRLPTSEKKMWHKLLEPLNKIIEILNSKSNRPKTIQFPESPWPLNAVIFSYPQKRTFGRDELIFWELKLFGEHADHGLFLEVILPAMEEASMTTNQKWNQRNRLWGRFDIENIFVARGLKWEPLVTEGKLDVKYRAHPKQWLEKLILAPRMDNNFQKINWISPCDLNKNLPSFYALDLPDEKQKLKFIKAPPMSFILHSLVQRITEILSLENRKDVNIEDIMSQPERSAFLNIFRQSLRISILQKKLRKTPVSWPGIFFGWQQFSPIPKPIIPYLNIASILHIGNNTHYGCGTFEIR